MSIFQRVLFITHLFFGVVSTLTAQTTWTGSVSAAWNTAGNWSAGVPNATDDVTIPAATNNPVISVAGALAKSVTVQTGGLLTVNAAGTLTINGATAQGLLNQGTVQNSGTITLGNTATVGLYGVLNNSLFYNNSGGKLNIDQATGSQSISLGNGAGSTFTNAGTITIGANAASGSYGIDNNATFNNNTGGIINIDRVIVYGIRNNAPFANAGTINIGASAGGTTLFAGISNAPTTTGFTNAAGGIVNIDRVSNSAISAVNYSTLNNAGTIIIGALTTVTTLITATQTGVVNNNTGGIFKGSGNIPSSHFTSAGGTLSPGSPAGIITFDNAESFSNSILSVKVNGTGAAGINYDQLVVNGTATLGGKLAVSINYTPATGDQVTILTAQAISDTFSTVTGLPANWIVNYTPTAVILSYGPLPYNTWTGAVSTNWFTAGNWTLGVPTAASDISIPNVTNAPVIGAAGAVAKSITVQIGGVLAISAAGTLSINGAAASGLWNQGTVQNSGTLNIGSTASVGYYGIVNSNTFNNNTGGQINIDRAVTAGLYALNNTFNNSGTIMVGALVSVPALLNNLGSGTVSNNMGGILKGTGLISAGHLTNAGGTLSPGNPVGIMSFSGSASFASSILAIDVNGTATAGTSFDQVTVPGTATLGGTLAVTIGYTPVVGDEVTILSATSVSGTFSTVTGLPAGWSVAYLTNGVQLTYGQNYWTGSVSTAWNTAGNWSMGNVPTAGQLVVIPNVTNNPVISVAGAVAKSVTLQSGSLLTVNAAGTLTINGATAQGLLNQGTVQNSGTITLGNTATVGLYGVLNYGLFYNNSGGKLNIDQATGGQSVPLENVSGGTFTNAGTITIGANAASGDYGIDNNATFNNNTGGIINIDRVSDECIRNNAPFTNAGTINIGASAGGTTLYQGITNTPSTTGFSNAAGGQIFIDRVSNAAIYAANYGTINNAGTITIGSLTTVATLIDGNQTGTVSNSTGGIIKGSGSIGSTYLTNAGGTLSPGSPAGIITFNAPRDFSNGILSVKVNGAGTAGTAYDQVIVSGAATLGGTLAISINYTPVVGDQVTIVSATAVSGTFGTITGLPANWYVNYTATQVVLSYGQSSTTTWTGAVSTNWNTAGNWTAGVPTATMDAIIPNVTNNPVLNTATAAAKSITVQSGGFLTIATTGSLTINGTTAQGIMNQGTVQNNGTITIGATAAVGQYGINNAGTFSNMAGQINIDRATSVALYNNTGSTFTNAAAITIGANAASGQYGIQNYATFNNNTGGQVKIDQVTTTAIFNVSDAFTNVGAITIGANAATGADGIDNDGVFNNNTGGQIKIDRVTSAGIYQNGTGFTNQGTITMGSLSAGNTISYGIYIDNNFSNTGGQINIDRVNVAITVNTNTFSNAGAITIGAATNVGTLLNSTGAGTFSNNTAGVFKGAGTIAAARYVNAGGTLLPGAPIGIMTFNANETFSNNTLAIEAKGNGVAGTDFDQVVVNGTATLGGTLAISTINGFKMAAGQSFVILTGTSVTGTFASVTWPTGVTGTVTYSGTAVTLNVPIPLPLTLLEFTGHTAGDKVVLQWKTSSEVNTVSFEVQRSTDGGSYTTIGTVAAAGNGANSYSTTDAGQVSGNNYYRLKMIDIDGQFTYSNTILVESAGKERLLVGPVPATSYVNIILKDQSLVGQHAQIYNITGVLVNNVVLAATTRIDISGWPAGIYNIKTVIGTYRFIKQ